ncbi:MAG: PQQ-binding-like beta-propeller repeat protein, partial [Planctomycetaceae bacterium]|nr:PQQ-binding-like beta-propeller repeat protein [Planctomycetaceae bacterium]
EEILVRLESESPDIARWIEHSGWLTSSGIPAQNPEVNASPPLLELAWKQRTLTQPKLLGSVRLVEGQMRLAKSVFLPTARPVAVGSVLIFRSYEGLIAVNVFSGKRLWVGKDYEYRASMFGTNPNIHSLYQPNAAQWVLALLRLTLWHNTAMGSLSSDGRLVFALEEEPVINVNYGNRLFIRGNGKQIEDPRMKTSTTLAARDAQTGEVVWRIGKAILVQKQLDQIEEQWKEENQKQQDANPNPPPGVVPRGVPLRVIPRIQVPVPAIPVPPPPPPPPVPAPIVVPVPETDEIAILQTTAGSVSDRFTLVKPVAHAPGCCLYSFFSLAARLFDTLLILDAEEPEEKTESQGKITITPEEQFLGETYFLGAPLPALGNLYVLGENGGVIRLFILDAQTGKLVRHIGLIEPQAPIDTDFLRRRLGPTPAYNEGIIVCPTAAGALCALDATTGKLLWCYTYSDQQVEDENQRNPGRGIRMGGPGNMNLLNFGGNSDFQNLIDHVGWAIPATILTEGKLIFAPADRPMLYCFDLLSGELLWKRAKGKGRYIACVYDQKVFVAASHSLVALDLNTGDSLWDDSALAPLVEEQKAQPVATGMPQVFFPQGVSPCGVGVRFGREYMIPMSDQSVIVVDLDAACIVRTCVPAGKTLNDLRLGHLLAIEGRIFSQSATEVSCFHQFETLRAWAEKTMQTDPNNSEAVLQLGRLAYAQGDRDEAIRLFRQSFSIKPTPQNKELLRSVLTDAMIADFAKYRIPLEEIESLQDSPDSLVPLLNAYATGCLHVGDYTQFVLAFRRILERDREFRLLHDTRNGNQYLLAEWIGEQVRLYEKEPELAEFMESLAREEFDRIEKLGTGRENPGAESLLYQWSKFITYFRTHPLAKIAGEKRVELLASRRQTSEMAMLAKIADVDLLPRLGGPPASWEEKKLDQQDANAGLLLKLARNLEDAGQFRNAFFYYCLLGPNENVLQNPAYQPFASARTWTGGTFDLREDESEEAEKFRNDWLTETQNSMNGYVPYSSLLSVGPIPFVAMWSPFFEHDEFSLFSDPNGVSSIVCRDLAGQKLWTLEIPQDLPDEMDSGNPIQYFGNMGYEYYSYNTTQPGCLVAYRHLLYYLRGKQILAIDTLKRDKSGTPAVLWTRTNQSPLTGFRLFRRGINAGFLTTLQYSNQATPLANPLFVHSNVLCFQDMDTLYGVDPLTGELLWSRESLSLQSYLTGDEEFVYQLRTTGEKNIPDIRYGNMRSESYEAIALDPATGKEVASGKLPQGIFHCFGSTLVCSVPLGQPGNELRIEVYDLKDFLVRSDAEKDELRVRALLNIQPQFRSLSFNNQAAFSLTENGRILAILTQEKNLQIYDLATRQTLVASARIQMQQAAEKGGQPVPLNSRQHDFHLEFDGDDFLLLLITDNNFMANRTNRQFLSGYPQRGVRRGMVMRYDRTGKPLWDQPWSVESWQFLESPRTNPFLLFGATMMNEGGNRSRPVIWGLNKKTGKREFSKEFDFSQALRNSQQQAIKVFVDTAQESLIFLSPEWVLRGKFEAVEKSENREMER